MISFAIGVVVLAVTFGPSLVAHVRYGLDPGHLNDDARVWIYPLERYHDRALFPDDQLGEYARACTPIGVRGLYALSGLLWSAEVTSKALPYLLLAVTVVAVWIAGKRFGLTAALASAALCFSTAVLLDRTVGGFARSFAFPIVACGVAALVHGRMGVLAVVTAVGAAFYPAAAAPGGIALAVLLLALPAADRASATGWSIRRRVAVIVLTALVAGLVQLPAAVALRRYGSFIRPGDVASYPEAGPGGRFMPGDRPPYGSYWSWLGQEAPHALSGAGEPFTKVLGAPGSPERRSRQHTAILLLLGIALPGLVALVVSDSGGRRMAALWVTSGLGFALASVFAPYLYIPQRYVLYPVPVLVILSLPAAASAWPRLLRCRCVWVEPAAILALTGATLLLVGGRGSGTAGYTIQVDGNRTLYAFVRALPKDALVAGWPSSEEVNNLPYVTLRQAFVTQECHMPFHAGFADEMRARMRAFLDAYFGSSLEPLVALRGRFRVTHLLVDTRHFEGARPPTYFKPFDEWTRQAWVQGLRDGLVVPRLAASPAAFRDGSYAVLDLARLEELWASTPRPAVRSETRRVDFDASSVGALVDGWSGFEVNPAGTTFVWAIGHEASLVFDCANPRPMTLEVTLWPHQVPGRSQRVRGFVNRHELGEVTLRDGSQQITVPVPASALRPGRNLLLFQFAYAVAPAEVRPDSRDQRPLACAFETVELVWERVGAAPTTVGTGTIVAP